RRAGRPDRARVQCDRPGSARTVERGARRRPHGARRSSRSAPGLLPGAEVVGEEPRCPAARPPRGEAPAAADPGAGGAVDGMVPARAPRGSLPAPPPPPPPPPPHPPPPPPPPPP